MNKVLLYLSVFCMFLWGGAVNAANYTYDTANISCKDYSKLAGDKIYKAMPRSFSYKDRNLQFAVTINKSGKADKAWILKSSGSEKYDNKVLSAVEKVDFGTLPSCAGSKGITYRYDMTKQSKIIPIPIPIWF